MLVWMPKLDRYACFCRARRLANASRNSAFSCTVSARALMCGILGIAFENHQTPPCHYQLALTIPRVNAHNGNLIGRRDVVARREVGLRKALRPEKAAVCVARNQVVVAAAHQSSAVRLA